MTRGLAAGFGLVSIGLGLGFSHLDGVLKVAATSIGEFHHKDPGNYANCLRMLGQDVNKTFPFSLTPVRGFSLYVLNVIFSNPASLFRRKTS